VKKDYNVELNSLVASIQFDQWIMVLGAPRCTVVSHLDEDHDPFLTRNTPPIIINGRMLSSRSKINSTLFYTVDPSAPAIHSGMVFWLTEDIRNKCQNIIKNFHADWWYIHSKTSGLLFVGDLNYPEIPVIPIVVKYIKTYRPLDAVLLPSYGGINPPAHHIPEDVGPTVMADAIATVAQNLKKEGIKVGGLPHPVPAPWSDFEFLRLPLSRKT